MLTSGLRDAGYRPTLRIYGGILAVGQFSDGIAFILGCARFFYVNEFYSILHFYKPFRQLFDAMFCVYWAV